MRKVKFKIFSHRKKFKICFDNKISRKKRIKLIIFTSLFRLKRSRVKNNNNNDNNNNNHNNNSNHNNKRQRH